MQASVPKAASDARRAATTGLAASSGPAASASGTAATTSLARRAVADEYAALLKSVPQLAGLGEVFKSCEPVRRRRRDPQRVSHLTCACHCRAVAVETADHPRDA